MNMGATTKEVIQVRLKKLDAKDSILKNTIIIRPSTLQWSREWIAMLLKIVRSYLALAIYAFRS